MYKAISFTTHAQSKQSPLIQNHKREDCSIFGNRPSSQMHVTHSVVDQ